jgi:D-beta-D-heptose 7-phosphate kinase / D-beta-D-heptose 1-phosphate adenosyltransferase
MNLPDFSNVNVLVIGDIMLDRYIYGSVNRISPEAPVPVVLLQNTIDTVGGAANVAANVVGLGAKVSIVGVMGNDSVANDLISALSKLNISSSNCLKFAGRKTTFKTRIVAQNHHIVRIDQESTKKLNNEEEKIVWESIEKLLSDASIVIISDYAKGLLTDKLLNQIISKCHEFSKIVIVDPKGKDFSKYQGANFLTPNRKEAIDAYLTDCIDIEEVGEGLIKNLDLESLLITEGEDGMSLFQKDSKSKKFSSVARKVFDVTGAGDTVIATLGVALGVGMDIIDSVELANIAAGIVVEKVGTTIIEIEALRNALKN